MNILLIFETIPEQTAIYWFEELKSEIVERLKRCHGTLLGIESDNTEDQEWLSKWILDQDEYIIFDSISNATSIFQITEKCLLICTGVYNVKGY